MVLGVDTAPNIIYLGGYRRPVHRADNFTTFMCRLFRNEGASTFWNPRGLSGLQGLLFTIYTSSCSIKKLHFTQYCATF